MKIVRALWGNNQKVLKEIPKIPLFEDEVVFVWGEDNFKLLNSLKYKTIKISSSDKYTNFNLQFYHKLEALILADKVFKEYIFLDWDIIIDKPIDDKFIGYLRKGNKIQCPIYSDYPINYAKQAIEKMRENGINEKKLDNYVNAIDKHLVEYSWMFSNYYVLPNFGFFYSRNANIGKKLMKICKENNISANVEEFALYKYINCSLESYIDKHSPVVMYGNERIPKVLKDYIDKRQTKDLYLRHDL